MYQETRFLNQDACFLKSRRETTIFYQLCFRGGIETEKSAMLHGLLHEESCPFPPCRVRHGGGIEELVRRIIRAAQGVNTSRIHLEHVSSVSTPDEELRR